MAANEAAYEAFAEADVMTRNEETVSEDRGDWRMPSGRKYSCGFLVIAEQVEGIFVWFCPKKGYGYIRRCDTEEEVWVHKRGLDIEIEESVQYDQKKRVIFDIVDAPKGNMAIRVRDYGSDCSVLEPEKNEEHPRILGDSPTEPSVVCEPKVCVPGWRSPPVSYTHLTLPTKRIV